MMRVERERYSSYSTQNPNPLTNGLLLFVFIFESHIHVRFKHAVLGPHIELLSGPYNHL